MMIKLTLTTVSVMLTISVCNMIMVLVVVHHGVMTHVVTKPSISSTITTTTAIPMPASSSMSTSVTVRSAITTPSVTSTFAVIFHSVGVTLTMIRNFDFFQI